MTQERVRKLWNLFIYFFLKSNFIFQMNLDWNKKLNKFSLVSLKKIKLNEFLLLLTRETTHVTTARVRHVIYSRALVKTYSWEFMSEERCAWKFLIQRTKMNTRKFCIVFYNKKRDKPLKECSRGIKYQ